MRLFTASILAFALISSASAQNAGPEIVADVVYGRKFGMALTLDVFKPAGKANGAGVLCIVSGGWVSRWQPPELAAQRYRALLDKGFTVFAVRHGSGPRFKVPEAVADVQRALQFVHRNAADFNIDPQRLGVYGVSAGGQLSLMLGLAAVSDGARLAAVVAYCPPVDLRKMVGPSPRFPALAFDPGLAAGVSPILFASGDDPPTLLIHGTADRLVPIRNSEAMLAALQGAGVPAELMVLKGAGHRFQGQNSRRAIAATVSWFEKHLLGNSG
jgi:acetyl esterase/lipase